MTIESRYVRMAYGNFIQEVEIVTVKLLRSDFKIRKPFKKLQELLNSSELGETSLSLTQRARFDNWCNRYTEDVLWDIENTTCDAKVIDSDDYWEVFTPVEMVNVNRDEIFNKIAHICGSRMWSDIHFGEVNSPLKFDEFIKNFEPDDWLELYNQLERCGDRMSEYVSPDIDDVLIVCNKLDLIGESEKVITDCTNYVFGE